MIQTSNAPKGIYVLINVLDVLKHSLFEGGFRCSEFKCAWYEVRWVRRVDDNTATRQEALFLYGRMNRDIVVQWEPTGFLSHCLNKPYGFCALGFTSFPWGRDALWITHCLSKGSDTHHFDPRLLQAKLAGTHWWFWSPFTDTLFHGHTEHIQDLSPVTVQLEKCE